MVTYSRVLASGRPYGWLCQASTTAAPDTPSPSRKRRPDSRSKVAAVIAVVPGDRPAICMIAVPSWIFVVWAANQASGLVASVPDASAVQTEWYPRSSASDTIFAVSERSDPHWPNRIDGLITFRPSLITPSLLVAPQVMANLSRAVF